VLGFQLHSLELHAAGRLDPVAFDAIEMFGEVVVSEGAAEFAVGCVFQDNGFLLADNVEDFLVLDRFEFGGESLPASRFSQACLRRAVWRRLPTWSARKGASNRAVLLSLSPLCRV